MPHRTDLDLTAKEVSELTSPDAITALLTKLGYDTAQALCREDLELICFEYVSG